MKTTLSNHVFIFLVLFLANSVLVAQVDDEVVEGGINVGSEYRTFTSKINTKKYKLHINLPQDYETKPEKEYPVFFVLDGQWDFGNIVPNYYTLEADKMIPKIIVVGITYGGENPNYDALRASDYTPEPIDGIPGTGGAAQFIEVLRDEILPLVDLRYRTNKTDRALAGNSFGGLLTHYTLFNAPELFNSYTIVNPSLWVNNQLPFKYEEEFSTEHTTLDKQVLMVGGQVDQGIETFEAMVSQIASRNYEGIDFDHIIMEGLGHNGVKAQAFIRGMLHSYKRTAITLPEAVLQEYTGDYQIDLPAPNNFEVQIVIQDGNLLLKDVPGAQDIPIHAASETVFFIPGSFNEFYFTRDDNGIVNGFKSEQQGQLYTFVKKKVLSNDDFNLRASKLVVHPNPTADLIYINDAPIGAMLNIYTMTGQSVLQKEITTTKETIDIATLKTGVYLVKIANQTISKIVVK